MFPGPAAQEALGQQAKNYIGLACGLAIAIAALGGGLGQGIAISKGLEGIARNPEAQPKIFIPMIVGLALDRIPGHLCIGHLYFALRQTLRHAALSNS